MDEMLFNSCGPLTAGLHMHARLRPEGTKISWLSVMLKPIKVCHPYGWYGSVFDSSGNKTEKDGDAPM